MRRVNDLSGDCCLWGINAQEESILGVKLVGWKIQEEKVLGGKNSGERWGPAYGVSCCILDAMTIKSSAI